MSPPAASIVTPNNNHQDSSSKNKNLLLSKFPSLQYSLENSILIALYFGASYCEENRLLRDGFHRSEMLLPPEPPQENDKKKVYPLAIVYIPFDSVEGSSEWIHVLEKKEQDDLKKRFHCGTTKEATRLKMEQRFPVPSLFVLDSSSHGVLTPMGLQEIQEKGAAGAVHHWIQFHESIKDSDPKNWAATELFRDDDDNTIQNEKNQTETFE